LSLKPKVKLALEEIGGPLVVLALRLEEEPVPPIPRAAPSPPEVKRFVGEEEGAAPTRSLLEALSLFFLPSQSRLPGLLLV